MPAAEPSESALRLQSDTRWHPGAGYALAEDGRGKYDVPPGGIAWLSFYEPRSSGAEPVSYYDISPVAERLDALGLDVMRPDVRGRTAVGRALTGLFAPALGHRGTGVFTAFGVEPSQELAGRLGAFSCLRAARISFVAFPDCLVTVRHRPTLWAGRGAGAAIGDQPGDIDEPRKAEPFATTAKLHKHVEQRWLEEPGSARVADLTLLAVRVLSASLRPAVSYLAGQLEGAEQVYFSVLDAGDERLDDGALRTAQRNLFDLAGIMASFGRELVTITDTLPADGTGWVVKEADSAEATAIVREYADAGAALRELRQDLRTSVDMTASTLASHQLVLASRQEERARQQLQLAEEQRTRNERFMRDATLVASLVLLPTLVATIYGANVGLPLKNRATGTLIMLAVMLVVAFGAWQLLRARYPPRR
jgi:hypothetical protein